MRGTGAAPTRLRDYQRSDFEALWTLDQRCFAPGIAYSRSELSAALSLETAEAIVAERNGRIVAFVLGSRPRRREGRLITLDVAAAARRRGLGRRLLTEIERRFRDAAVERIRLETATDNTAAIALYERLGYAKTKYLADYYGPRLHAWKMEKQLDRRLVASEGTSPDRPNRPRAKRGSSMNDATGDRAGAGERSHERGPREASG